MSTTTYTEEVVCVSRAGTLYDTLELILDRGMVIDVFVRVSLLGIEVLKIDARIVVASVDTYLRFAEVCNRVDLERETRSQTVPELFEGPGTKLGKKVAKKAVKTVSGKTAKKATKKMGEKVREAVSGGDEEDEERPPRRQGAAGARRRPRSGEE